MFRLLLFILVFMLFFCISCFNKKTQDTIVKKEANKIKKPINFPISKETSNKHSIMAVFGARIHNKDPKAVHPLATGATFEEKMHRSYVLFAKDWGLDRLYCTSSGSAEQYKVYDEIQYQNYLKNLVKNSRWILDQAKESGIDIYIHIETPAGRFANIGNTYYAEKYNPDHPEYTQKNFWTNDTFVREGLITPLKRIIDTFGENGTEANSRLKGVGFTFEPRSGGGVPNRTYTLPSTWVRYNEEMVDYLVINAPNTVWTMAITFGGDITNSNAIAVTNKLRNGNVDFIVYGWYPFDYTIHSDRCGEQPRYKYSYNHWLDGSQGDWTRGKTKLWGYSYIENWRISNNILASRIQAGANTNISSPDRYKFYRDRFAAATSYGYGFILGNFGSHHYAFSTMYEMKDCSKKTINYEDENGVNNNVFASYNPQNRDFKMVLNLISRKLEYKQSQELSKDPELTDITKWKPLPQIFTHTGDSLVINNISGNRRYASMEINTQVDINKTYQVVAKIANNKGTGGLSFSIGGVEYCTLTKAGEVDNVYACELTVSNPNNNQISLLAEDDCQLTVEYLLVHEIM